MVLNHIRFETLFSESGCSSISATWQVVVEGDLYLSELSAKDKHVSSQNHRHAGRYWLPQASKNFVDDWLSRTGRSSGCWVESLDLWLKTDSLKRYENGRFY